MFDLFRKGAGSLIAGVLLTLLIFSFALWGIGDPLSTLGGTDIAEVGDDKVTPNELARTFETDFRQLQQQAGDSLTKELAAQIIGPQSVAKLVERKAYDVEVSNLGLRAADEELRDYIYNIPTFQNADGTFNRSFFDQVALAQGYSSKEFENVIQTDLVRLQLVTALMNNMQAPDISTNTLTKYATEERISEILSIPASAMTSIGEVNDETLTEFYNENSSNYMAPEYRDVSYFEISASEYAAQIEISDDQALEYYEARIADFTQEEQRSFVQMLLDDQETADIAFSELESGKSFDIVIEDKTGETSDDATFELQTRTEFAELYGEDAADSLFSLNQDGYTSPIESGFGVYIFKVAEIVEGSSESFESVKDNIIKDLQAEQSIDQLYAVRDTIDDELAAGAILPEIGDVISAEVKTVSNVSIEGMTPDGTASNELPLIVDFLDRAFQNEVGGELELYEGIADKFYMISVDDIIPAVLRPFDDVKEQVNLDWAQSRRETLASELATQITEDYNSAENAEKSLTDFQDVLSSDLVVNEVTVDRANAENAVAANIHTSIFGQDIGSIEMIPAANGDGFVLVRVKDRTFKEEVDEEALTQTQEQIKTSYQNDLMGAYIVHLYDALPVVINDNNVQAVFTQIAAPTEQ